jgi:glycogen debranching enzyme
LAPERGGSAYAFRFIEPWSFTASDLIPLAHDKEGNVDNIKIWIAVGLIVLLLLGGLTRNLTYTAADTPPQRTVALEGRQALSFGDIQLEKTDEMSTIFFLSGNKMYEIGAMSGDFPVIGWHIDGEMGGVWAHPMKVLDGFYFEIDDDEGTWLLTDCKDFSHSFVSADFRFEKNGLEVERTDFVVEKESALFSLITIRNIVEQAKSGTLRFIADIDLRPSWYSSLHNGKDRMTYQDGRITGYDTAEDGWGVILGADISPSGHEVTETRGVLEYPFSLGAGEVEDLRFLIVAEHEEGLENAVARFDPLMEQCSELLDEKIARYKEKVFGGVEFSCSDPLFQQAYYCAKANLVMLSADVSPYIGRYCFAGVPEYVQLFGCDTAYSIPGLVSVGFDDEAVNALKNIAQVGERQQGRIPHEISTSGKVYNKGNVQETPQFTSACWEYFRFTGDRPFLEEMYPLCKQGIFGYVLKFRDSDKDHYSEGSGMVERSGMGPEKLDSTCYLYKAILDLSQMAVALNKEEEAAQYTNLAEKIKQKFNDDWWIETEGMFADSLGWDNSRKFDGHWIVAVPMEVEIADQEKGARAIKRIEQEWVNQWGLVHTKRLEERVWTLPTSVLAQAEFNYGNVDLGTYLLGDISSTINHGMFGAFSELIPQGGDFMQLWSAAMFLEGITEGIFGLKPLASEHELSLSPQLPSAWQNVALTNIKIGKDTVDISVERQDGGTKIALTQHGETGLKIELTLPAGEKIVQTSVGIPYTQEEHDNHSILSFVLNPGQQEVITSAEASK